MSFKKPTPEMKALLKKSGSPRHNEHAEGMAELAKALEMPLRKGIFAGNILFDIFETIVLDQGTTPEFPLDFVAPGTEASYVAYTIPNQGHIPQRNVEGDYVMVPVYPVGNAIDWNLRYARDARWDIVKRAMMTLEAGFTKKMNDDGWHTLLGAGVDRNIVVFDGDATAGQFTKRLVSLAKVIMRRNGGGNSTSINRGKLTDLYMSPENIEDIRNWGIDQVDEFTRRDLFLSSDGSIKQIFGVNLHDIDELGEDQEYQSYFTNTLAGSLPSGKLELSVGLDLTNRDSFVMPIRQEVEIFEDPTLHRQLRAGVYAWMEAGWAALDGRRVLLLSN